MSTEPESDGHPSLAVAAAILAEQPSPEIANLIRYWLSIHPENCLPGRQHFEPLEIARLLPHIVLVDIEKDERRYRIRVMGTAVVEAIGADYTGAFCVDTLPNFRESLSFRHRVEVEESGLPAYHRGPASIAFRLDYAPVEWLHLPLAGDGRIVDKILSMTLYAQDKSGTGDPA